MDSDTHLKTYLKRIAVLRAASRDTSLLRSEQRKMAAIDEQASAHLFDAMSEPSLMFEALHAHIKHVTPDFDDSDLAMITTLAHACQKEGGPFTAPQRGRETQEAIAFFQTIHPSIARYTAPEQDSKTTIDALEASHRNRTNPSVGLSTEAVQTIANMDPKTGKAFVQTMSDSMKMGLFERIGRHIPPGHKDNHILFAMRAGYTAKLKAIATQSPSTARKPISHHDDAR